MGTSLSRSARELKAIRIRLKQGRTNCGYLTSRDKINCLKKELVLKSVQLLKQTDG